MAADRADYVLALDADHLVVDRLYDSLKAEDRGSILPLVADVADPSPGLGWRGLERRPLADRGAPDLILCLALAHHVVIGRNVPLADFVAWLAGFGAEVVVEIVDREDPMVDGCSGIGAARPSSTPTRRPANSSPGTSAPSRTRRWRPGRARCTMMRPADGRMTLGRAGNSDMRSLELQRSP